MFLETSLVEGTSSSTTFDGVPSTLLTFPRPTRGSRGDFIAARAPFVRSAFRSLACRVAPFGAASRVPEGSFCGFSGVQPLPRSTVGVWPADEFKSRLEVMRDLYALVNDRDEPWAREKDPYVRKTVLSEMVFSSVSTYVEVGRSGSKCVDNAMFRPHKYFGMRVNVCRIMSKYVGNGVLRPTSTSESKCAYVCRSVSNYVGNDMYI